MSLLRLTCHWEQKPKSSLRTLPFAWFQNISELHFCIPSTSWQFQFILFHYIEFISLFFNLFYCHGLISVCCLSLSLRSIWGNVGHSDMSFYLRAVRLIDILKRFGHLHDIKMNLCWSLLSIAFLCWTLLTLALSHNIYVYNQEDFVDSQKVFDPVTQHKHESIPLINNHNVFLYCIIITSMGQG